MSRAPVEPKPDWAKFPEASGWLPRLWDVLRPFLLAVVEGFNRGLTVGENMRAFVKDITIEAGQTYPLEFASELPAGVKARGVELWALEEKAAPDAAIVTAVRLDWQNATRDGKAVIRIRAAPGLDTAKAYKATLAVFGG